MLACALAISFSEALHEWASPLQRGFIGDRAMLQNVVDVDHQCIKLAASDSKQNAVALFFDYAAVFPSIPRLSIWLAMLYLDIPVQ
eukprot:1263546-Karenia_brevis.AAC.1